MNATAPSSLGSDALACRLRELVGEERNVQVDFLLHLDEFDRRRAFLEAGFDSLWAYCLTALHLREGPAGRRIGAMRVLRRFPLLEGALRDGRLCLSTVTLLGPLLTEDNLDVLVARAAYRTKAEVEHLVVSLQPRIAPREGIRKLPEKVEPAREPASIPPEAVAFAPEPVYASAPVSSTESSPMLVLPEPAPCGSTSALPPPDTRRSAEMRPISREELKGDLETLRSLLSHKAGGDLAAVLREAVRCAIEKHGKRKGAVKPARERAAIAGEKSAPTPGARSIPAAVRRLVWERDGGCCTWKGSDGRRCGSRWKLEMDHIHPVALGGASTPENLRILCARHNALHAAQIFGREHMERFAKRSTHPGMSGSSTGPLDAPA